MPAETPMVNAMSVGGHTGRVESFVPEVWVKKLPRKHSDIFYGGLPEFFKECFRTARGPQGQTILNELFADKGG